MRASHVATAVAVAFVALPLLQACGGADARRQGHMSKGGEYFAAENYEKARVEFQNVLQIVPNDAQARFMLGRTAEKLGNLREAASSYQGAIDVDPKHVEAIANLGRMYVFAGAPDRALETIRQAIVDHPDDPDLLTVRGASRIQQQDRAGALADATRAVSLAPSNENAVALLASIHRQAGELDQAAKVIEVALADHPRSVDLRQVLAAIYSEARRPDLAEQRMREIIALRPAQLAFRYQLALFLARSGKPAAAEKAFEEAIAQEPANAEPKLAYVEFLAAQNDLPRAAKVLRGFIDQRPDDPALKLGLGALQQRSRDNPAAAATYEAIIAADERGGPAALTARNRIAAIRLGEGKFDAARQLVDEVLAKNPRDNDALVLRSSILLEKGDSAGAIADLRAVLRDQPGSVTLMRSLARAHLVNGEPALAEESLRAAREAAPADVPTRLDFAQLLAQTGRAAQAVTLLEETVLKSPDNPMAREMLVKAYISNGDLAQAIKAAEDLKLVAPAAASGPYLLGLIARGQNRIDDAEREFQKALELQPDAPDVLMGWASVQVLKGRTAAAIERVQAISARNPSNMTLRNLLGELHLQARNYPAAIATLSVVVKADPSSWIAHRNLALAHIAAGDARSGELAYREGLDRTGHAFALVSDLAVIYERQKRPADAIAVYEQFFRRNPKFDAAANNLAMLLVTYRSDAASLDRARDLTAGFAGSNTAAYLDTFGWVRLRRGETAEALAALERAASLAPDSRVIRYHLGMAQKKAGQAELARRNLEQALAGSSGFAGADEARVALRELAGGDRSNAG